MKTIKADRQGDLIFVKLDKLPENLKPLKFNKEFILALGEKSGNAHILTKEREETKINIYQDKEGRYYFQVEDGNAIVRHQGATATHREFVFSPGIYVQDIQVEFDELEEIRKVSD